MHQPKDFDLGGKKDPEDWFGVLFPKESEVPEYFKRFRKADPVTLRTSQPWAGLRTDASYVPKA